MSITSTQALKSIDALGTINKDNVESYKLSYSNNLDEIYIGSSSGLARTVGSYFGAYYNYNHANLKEITSRICSALTTPEVLNSDLAVVQDLSSRVENAVAGYDLMSRKYYRDAAGDKAKIQLEFNEGAANLTPCLKTLQTEISARVSRAALAGKARNSLLAQVVKQ